MEAEAGKAKVNLGCGNVALPDWVNFDNSLWIILANRAGLAELLSSMGLLKRERWACWKDKKVRRFDVRKSLPFDSGGVEFIYTSHLFEHLLPAECAELLEECDRVLVTGGLLRVVTPDLEHLFHMYRSLKKDFHRDNPAGNVPADHFMKCLGILPENHPPGSRRAWSDIFKRKKHLHKWLYDYDSLHLALNRAGFMDIKRKRVGEGEMADLDRLEDNYPYPESLFVEARAD